MYTAEGLAHNNTRKGESFLKVYVKGRSNMNLNLRQYGKTLVTIAATAVISIGWATQAGAATGTWTGVPGATWDTSSNNWSGVTDPAWNLANGAVNTARFNTADATPSVSGIVYANRLTFDNTATIGGSGTITLNGTTPKLTVNANATINSALAGTVAVTKDGSGTLVLANAISPYSGALTVTNGELNLASGCMFTNVSYIIPSAAGAIVRLTGGIVTNKLAATTSMNYGSFIQESGTNVIFPVANYDFYIGNAAGQQVALYEMKNGYFNSGTKGFAIGSAGNGTFDQTGGTVDLMRNGDLLQMGGVTGIQGFYKISGGTLNALAGSAAALQLGYNGSGSTGKMTIASAGVVNTLTVKLGSTLVSTALGILNLQGGGVLRVNSVYNNNELAVHQFNFSGGTLSPYNTNATIGSATAANNTTITLSGTDATISSSDKDEVGRRVSIYSKLTGSGAVTFTGNGTSVLIATNDYAGTTTLSNGTTLARMSVALPGYGTSGRLSVAPGAVLALNYGGASDWVSSEVDSLLSQNGTGFASGSALGFDTSNGNGVYGNITLAGLSLVKLGTNTLTLSGANTYSNTTINGGALRLNSALGSGNLTLNGGALELQNPSTFTRTLGSGAGQVQLTNASGFSAYGSAATVNLNNDNSELVWGSAYFSPGPLILNSATANAALDFQNPINLNNTGSALTRTVEVAAATATLSYSLTNSSGNAALTKTGAGTLTLAANNSWGGVLSVNAGTVLMKATNTMSSYVSISAGAELVVTNGATLTTVGNPSTISGTLRVNGGNFGIGASTTKCLDITSGGQLFIESGTVSNATITGRPMTSLGTINLSGGEFKCWGTSGYIYLGHNGGNSAAANHGTGIITQSGGTLNLDLGSTAIVLGRSVGATASTGTYTMVGGTLNQITTGGNVQIGMATSTGKAVGTLTISNDTAVANILSLVFGYGANAEGTLNLAAGTLRVNSLYNFGDSTYPQTFNFSGGTLSPYSTNATIGSATTSNNTTITLSGNATISSSDKDGNPRRVSIYSQLTGSGSITFTGNGTNVLIASTSDFTGNMTLNGGTTIWSNKCMKATSDLIFTNAPTTLILAFNETNTIRRLIVNGVIQNAAVYNSANLPAGVTIAGTGAIETTVGPPATGIVLIIE